MKDLQCQNRVGHLFPINLTPQFKTRPSLISQPSQVGSVHTPVTATCHVCCSCGLFPSLKNDLTYRGCPDAGMEGIKEKRKNRRFQSSNILKSLENIS